MFITASVLHASRAPEPCDVLWEAAGETGWRRWLGPVATVAATCLLLALSFALQYGLAAAAAHQSDGRCAACKMCAPGLTHCLYRAHLPVTQSAMTSESIACEQYAGLHVTLYAASPSKRSRTDA